MSLFSRITKPMYITLGNHDQWKKESGEVNILKFLSMVNKNITVFKDTTELKIGNDNVLFVPFLYNRNKVNEMKNVMKKNKYDYIVGHFDFNEYGGKESQITVGSNTFKNNTKLVISGHFHIQKDETKNGVRIKHIGTPYHLNRGDRFTTPGAWIFDSSKKTWELFENDKSVRFVDIDLLDLMKGKSFDVHKNVVNLFVKTSTFNKLGDNSIAKNNVLNGVVDSLRKYEPFELNVKPYNDEIESSTELLNDDIDLDFKSLTDFNTMTDKYFEIRFKKTGYKKKLLEDCKEMIKELL